MPAYELKLEDGRTVRMTGDDGVAAAHRWVDMHRDDAVVAIRPSRAAQDCIVTGVTPGMIIG